MSKKSLCASIAADHPNASRQELIALFHTNVPGISPGAASSYASSVRIDNPVVQLPVEYRKAETDEEIATRLAERFRVIDTLAEASCVGRILSLVISGPAGLGKSFTVENTIRQYDPDHHKTAIVKGTVRATGLYLLLHEYRHKGNVIVMDDADSIFQDQDALNLLKAACDTTKERWISWRAETKMVDVDGDPIDRTFEFNGTIIFITNRDFDSEIQKGGKNAEHFEALSSRSHYVTCDMNTTRDYLVRIKQVIELGMLKDQKGMGPIATATILSFIENNAEKFRELTLRLALKLADVYKINPDDFEALARISTFKKGH